MRNEGEVDAGGAALTVELCEHVPHKKTRLAVHVPHAPDHLETVKELAALRRVPAGGALQELSKQERGRVVALLEIWWDGEVEQDLEARAVGLRACRGALRRPPLELTDRSAEQLT